ncbi:MAG: DivIVA domain-containing protein [Actinomycetes bacterium]
MSYQFSRVGKSKRGYEIEQVNEFLIFAKDQFANPEGELLTAESVRATRFKLEKNGYSISAVDAAMEKLEDVFAGRELERTIQVIGVQEFKDLLKLGQELLANRVAKKSRRRFKRRSFPYRGYNRRQVDNFCLEVATHLNQSTELTVKQVRLVAFKTQRGGYAEYQVDAFIAKLVEVLQRESILEKTSN